MKNRNDQQLIETKTAAQILDLSSEMVRKLVRSGKLSAITLPSGRRIFDRSVVEALARQRQRDVA